MLLLKFGQSRESRGRAALPRCVAAFSLIQFHFAGKGAAETRKNCEKEYIQDLGINCLGNALESLGDIVDHRDYTANHQLHRDGCEQHSS